MFLPALGYTISDMKERWLVQIDRKSKTPDTFRGFTLYYSGSDNPAEAARQLLAELGLAESHTIFGVACLTEAD